MELQIEHNGTSIKRHQYAKQLDQSIIIYSIGIAPEYGNNCVQHFLFSGVSYKLRTET